MSAELWPFLLQIYPDREEYEAAQEKTLAKLSKSHSTAALQKSIEEGMRLQAQMRRMRKFKSHQDSPNHSRPSHNHSANEDSFDGSFREGSEFGAQLDLSLGRPTSYPICSGRTPNSSTNAPVKRKRTDKRQPQHNSSDRESGEENEGNSSQTAPAEVHYAVLREEDCQCRVDFRSN